MKDVTSTSKLSLSIPNSSYNASSAESMEELGDSIIVLIDSDLFAFETFRNTQTAIMLKRLYAFSN